MKNYVLIVAGGSGTRMESEIPKQFLHLQNKPVLMHSIEAFYNYDNSLGIIISLPASHIEYWQKLCSTFSFNIYHKTVPGGETRYHSVKNGLNEIHNSGLTAIHDGVRPLVSQKTIKRCFELANEKGNAIPVVEISESIRQTGNDQNKSVHRDHYKIVQTPQVFKTELIKKAYQQDFKERFTDDASLLDEMGETLYLTPGNRENIKITTQSDLIFAEAWMK